MSTELVTATQPEPVQPSAARAAVRAWAVPPVTAFEKDGDLRVRFDIPGVRPGDATVEVSDGHLIVVAPRADQPTRGWQRALRLSDLVDPSRVTASHANGVLTVDLPRSEASKPRRVHVSVG